MSKHHSDCSANSNDDQLKIADDDFCIDNLALDNSGEATNEEIIEALGADDGWATRVSDEPATADLQLEPQPAPERSALMAPDAESQAPASDQERRLRSWENFWEGSDKTSSDDLPLMPHDNNAELGAIEDIFNVIDDDPVDEEPQPAPQEAPAPASVGDDHDRDLTEGEQAETIATLNDVDQRRAAAYVEPASQDGAVTLNTALAPGCYGLSVCFKEGSEECSTCPFALTCAPLAKEQLATLLAEGIKTWDDVAREQGRERKRNQRVREAAQAPISASTPAAAPSPRPGPQPSRSIAMRTELEQAIANRHPTDRFLQNLKDDPKEYVAVAILAWSGKLSAGKIATIYNGKFGSDMSKKQVENRLKAVAKLVERGIWQPFKPGAQANQPGADQPGAT